MRPQSRTARKPFLVIGAADGQHACVQAKIDRQLAEHLPTEGAFAGKHLGDRQLGDARVPGQFAWVTPLASMR